jgi:hypothetical protein
MATIKQTITLEGSEEIKKALEALGKAAENAAKSVQQSAGGADGFDKVGAAAEKAAEGIGKTAQASQQAEAQLTATGKAAENTAGSFSNVSLQSVKTAAEIAKLGAEIALVGVKITKAVTAHDGLVVSLAKMGLHTVTAARNFELLAAALGPVGIAIGSIGIAIGGVAIGLVALEKAATAAAKGYEKLNHELQVLAQTSGTPFESLQQGAQALEGMGIKSETARNAVAKLDQTLKDFDTGAKLKESADKLLQSEKELLQLAEKVDAAGGRRITFNERVRLLDINKQLESSTTNLQKVNEEFGTKGAEHAKLLANNLSSVIPLIKKLEEGQKGIKFDELTTTETKVAALNARLKEITTTTGDARQAFVSIIANAESLKDALAFGKTVGFSDDDVDRIRRFGGEAGKIPDLFDRMKKSGALISPEASARFDEMRTSIQDVENAYTRLNAAWSSTLFPQAGAVISSTLNNIEAGFINFAAKVVESFNMLGGQLLQVFGQIASGWGIILNQITSGLGTIAAGLAALVTTAVGGAWQWIVTTFNGAVASLSGMLGQAASAIAEWVTTAPGNAWQWIVDTFNAAVEWVGTQATELKNSVWKAVTEAPANAWQWVVDTFKAILAKMGLGGSAAPAAPAGGAPGLAGGGRVGGRGSGTSDSNLAWLSRGEYIVPARIVQQPGVLAFLEALRRSGRLTGHASGGLIPAYASGGQVTMSADTLVSKLRQIGELLVTAAETASQNASAMDDVLKRIAFNTFDALNAASFQVEDMARNVDQTLVKAVEILKEMIGSLGGKAAGGLLGGRGTGTSDSNLAWVSRGEHIMPAHAVAQPGVLAFLEALRRSGGNLRDVLDGMGRFALGGLVRAPIAIPAFAGGGGMNNVTIQFPGLPEITGLRASSGVVDELRKAAAMAQVRSGGRKPSRYS